MGVMWHLAFKNSTGGGVPSPVDGDSTTPWPLDTWAALMPLFSHFGGTVAVLPPMTKGASLGAGYDPYDHYDLGSKMQTGRRETRYGSVETAMNFVASCRRLGMEVYVNVVHHHVDGDSGDQLYTYKGADGKTKNGRFPKDQHCFCQTWPNPDTVADSSWDLAFGREFMWNLGSYGDGKGANDKGYVRRNLAASLDWQSRRLGVDGYFFDDVKGTSPEYIGYVMEQGVMKGKVAFGEYSDGQTNNLEYWMYNTACNQTCGVMDFPLKYKFNNVLNNAGHADIRQILSEGVLWRSPQLAITFLDDADSDLSSPVIWNKLLGYAMILTFPGYPMIFGKDAYKYPGCYGLLDPILNLVWIHETFATGDLLWRFTDYNMLVYERMGDNTSSGLIAAVNNYPGDFNNPHDWRAITVQTKWINTHLHDYTGHSNDLWTDARGMVTLWVPPNDNGRGYVVFAVAGVTTAAHLKPRTTQQTFFGADDLDTPAARNGTLNLGTVLAGAGTALSSKVRILDPVPGASIAVDFVAADGTVVELKAPHDGLYSVLAVCSGFPATGTQFEIDVSYEAPLLPIQWQ